MNERLLCLMAWMILSPVMKCLAGSAEVHLYSLSVRIQPATATSSGLNYKLELTSGSPAESSLNGELAPLPAGAASSHGSFYRLAGDVLPVFGGFFINVPPAVDSNTNGVPDFFEAAKSVLSTTTTGTYEDLDQSGRVTTTWSRSANTNSGICRLNMDGYKLTFDHAFELQQFSGRLNYGSTETNITGSVTLTNAANASRVLTGPVRLEKQGSDRLDLQSGTWRNEAGLLLPFQAAEPLSRQGNQFVAGFVFRDGDPGTPTEDYVLWVIRIQDSNDTDGNGIPDIADKPVPRQPSLGISASGTNVLFSISGDIGKRHELQQIFSLALTNWTTIASVILTNDPQVLSVPAPTNRLAFWRTKLQ